jgi:hypothetical protein
MADAPQAGPDPRDPGAHDGGGERQPPASDPRAGAPRPSRTGTVARIGFDDPGLRPLPTDKLDYHVPHTDAHPEQHEHSDVPIRPLVIGLVTIAVMCVVSFVMAWWMFGRYDRQQRALEIPRTNVPNAKPPIPEPRLEAVPGLSTNPERQDVNALRSRYRLELNGWLPAKDEGFAEVPVDRAMDLAVERGMFKSVQGGARRGATTRPVAQQQQRPARGSSASPATVPATAPATAPAGGTQRERGTQKGAPR